MVNFEIDNKKRRGGTIPGEDVMPASIDDFNG